MIPVSCVGAVVAPDCSMIFDPAFTYRGVVFAHGFVFLIDAAAVCSVFPAFIESMIAIVTVGLFFGFDTRILVPRTPAIYPPAPKSIPLLVSTLPQS